MRRSPSQSSDDGEMTYNPRVNQTHPCELTYNNGFSDDEYDADEVLGDANSQAADQKMQDQTSSENNTE